jgi:acyl-CoA thioesterase
MTYAQKPALDHSVYDSWKTFKGVSIPRHGDILMYTMTPSEGDVVLVVENIRTGKRFEVPRATQAVLSRDEAKVIALIKPLFKQTREAKIKKQKEMPKDTLAVIDVKTGEVKKFPNHKSYAVPRKLTSHIAFELSSEKEKSNAKSAKPVGGDAKKAEKKKADKNAGKENK